MVAILYSNVYRQINGDTLVSDAKSIGDIEPDYQKVGCQKLYPLNSPFPQSLTV